MSGARCTSPLPTLRATRDLEGFPIASFGDWFVETVGMHGSDVADCCGDERMARLFAASPDLLAACMEVVKAWNLSADKENRGNPLAGMCARDIARKMLDAAVAKAGRS